MKSLLEYYRMPVIMNRIAEYLGGAGPDRAACVYVSGCNGAVSNGIDPRPPRTIYTLLKERPEIYRSLWDRQYLLAHLDMEYVNFDFPGEPFLHPGRSFSLQEPVRSAIASVLNPLGVFPLNLVSGRGFHAVWRMDIRSNVYQRIAALGNVPDHLLKRCAALGDRYPAAMRPDLASAYHGLGMIMEYLVLVVLDRSAGRCAVPVEVTAVKCGPGRRGREIVSIDLSEYGDPLDTRIVRVPYSAYLKHCRAPYRSGDDHGRCRPFFMIPLDGLPPAEALEVMREPDRVVELAAKAPVHIPDHTAHMHNLVNLYLGSDLARFHCFFYGREHEQPGRWAATYDRTPLENLPPCVAFMLRHPNPHLLQPAAIRQLVRAMLALGWHPRHIAGLIRSKYERDHGWEREWMIYDAATRADFYTRLFSGLFFTGRDELVDFNCVSSKEKHLCFSPRRGCNLNALRDSLLERRRHERLGHRPFNRLFPTHADI